MGILFPVVLSLVSAAPSASTKRQAERLGEQAKADRLAGGFKTGIEEATRAFQSVPRAAFLFEIAEDYRGLGDWPQAITYYERYLATHPGGPTKALAKRHLAEAKKGLRGSGGDALALAPLAPAPLAAAPLTPAPAPQAGSLEAAPLTAAPLAPPPLVDATPAPAAPPPAAAAPPAAVGNPFGTENVSGEVSEKEPAHHSHALAYTLIGVSAASLVVAVVGWGNVVSYDGFAGAPPPGTPASTGISRQSTAQVWWDAALATTIVAALAGGAVAFTW